MLEAKKAEKTREIYERNQEKDSTKLDRQEKNEKSGSTPPGLPSGYMKISVVGPNGFEPATTRAPFT